jgi:hypothetical protein
VFKKSKDQTQNIKVKSYLSRSYKLSGLQLVLFILVFVTLGGYSLFRVFAAPSYPATVNIATTGLPAGTTLTYWSPNETIGTCESAVGQGFSSATPCYGNQFGNSSAPAQLDMVLSTIPAGYTLTSATVNGSTGTVSFPAGAVAGLLNTASCSTNGCSFDFSSGVANVVFNFVSTTTSAQVNINLSAPGLSSASLAGENYTFGTCPSSTNSVATAPFSVVAGQTTHCNGYQFGTLSAGGQVGLQFANGVPAGYTLQSWNITGNTAFNTKGQTIATCGIAGNISGGPGCQFNFSSGTVTVNIVLAQVQVTALAHVSITTNGLPAGTTIYLASPNESIGTCSSGPNVSFTVSTSAATTCDGYQFGNSNAAAQMVIASGIPSGYAVSSWTANGAISGLQAKNSCTASGCSFDFSNGTSVVSIAFAPSSPTLIAHVIPGGTGSGGGSSSSSGGSSSNPPGGPSGNTTTEVYIVVKGLPSGTSATFSSPNESIGTCSSGPGVAFAVNGSKACFGYQFGNSSTAAQMVPGNLPGYGVGSWSLSGDVGGLNGTATCSSTDPNSGCSFDFNNGTLTLTVNYVSVNNELLASQELKPGGTLKSANGFYTLDMQTAGNLVLHNSSNHAIWASTCTPRPQDATSFLTVFGTDGNAVIFNPQGNAIWQSGTSGTGTQNYLILQTDGNLVLYNGSGTALWSSGTYSGTPDLTCTGSGAGGQGGTVGQINDPEFPQCDTQPNYVGSVICVANLEAQKGIPYVYGGGSNTGPISGGFDCSSFMQFIMYQGDNHLLIPRVAQDQYNAAPTKLPTSAALQPGDMVFYGGGTGDISHVAMYEGNGMVIQALETGTLLGAWSVSWMGSYVAVGSYF